MRLTVAIVLSILVFFMLRDCEDAKRRYRAEQQCTQDLVREDYNLSDIKTINGECWVLPRSHSTEIPE